MTTKIEINYTDTGVVGARSAGEFAIGTAFHGSIGPYAGVFLRTFHGLVYLNAPQHTWTWRDASADRPGGPPFDAGTVVVTKLTLGVS